MTAPSVELDLREPERPPITRAEFGSVMSCMAASVTVVSAREGSEQLGRTATSVLSLSATPPAVLVAIDIMAPLADLITRVGGFSLAILARDQELVGDAFAGKFDPRDRFARGSWSCWPSGQPKLEGAASALDCELIGRIQTQTHVLFAGAIVAADVSASLEPLVWYQRQYHAPRRDPAPAREPPE